MSARTEDLKRSQRSMIVVRWAAAAFAAFQVAVYDNKPYPSSTYRTLGFALAASLAVGNLAVLLAARRSDTLRGQQRIAVAGLALDFAVAHGFVLLFTFDQLSALWAVTFIIPLEGAIMFQLRGALITWAVGTALYVARDVWGASAYPAEYPVGVQWSSVTFRRGIGLLIAMVAGLMARDLTRQRRQLREALTEIRRIDRMRSALVSTLAHDVRNPLTAIRGSLTLLRTHGRDLDAQIAAELLEASDHQAQRLERLATGLLDLARLERGRLELDVQEVKLRDVVTGALSYADPERKYEVEVEPDLVVRADAERLEQVVVNLATNALRYGEAPYVVEGHRQNGAAYLIVKDHGPGIAPEDARELFEPFRTESKAGSVGLGLAIVKALIEAHGGEVRYEPNRPTGASFVVRLPVEGPQPA